MSDTPRMKAAQMAAMEHMTGDVYRVGCDIERELNAANERINQRDEWNKRLDELIDRQTEKIILLSEIRQEAGLQDTNLRKNLSEANDRIKRLEEAGDALCENSHPSRWDSPADAARKLTEQSNWRKAKEAKP